MDIKEKINELKHRIARGAMKLAAVAVMGSAGVATSCTEINNENVGESGEKIENVTESKTSVVFRTKFDEAGNDSDNMLLLENGDALYNSRNSTFLEVGDTITYEGNKITAIRYKGGEGKQVNFGEIGKISKDRTY